MGTSLTHADLLVVGATPAGIACAVRAAREGLRVLLLNRTQVPGGMLSNGLGAWDTLYDGRRAPIFDEVKAAIIEYYRQHYGDGSPQHRAALPGPHSEPFSAGRFEPKVARLILERLVTAEHHLTVWLGATITEVRRRDRTIEAMRADCTHAQAWPPGADGPPSERPWLTAGTFVDATYEGDVMALAATAYRVGRESRDEYGEPHAGRVFMRKIERSADRPGFPREAYEGRLPLRYYFHTSSALLMPESTGAGDGRVQAYNLRLILSRTDAILPPPPQGPPPTGPWWEDMTSRLIGLPNDKMSWNRPQLIGPHNAYVEGDWPTRERIRQQHYEAALFYLWHLQNDPRVPAPIRDAFAGYGVARDELAGEIYARETRRLVGRYVFTEHDAVRQLAQPDSIAFTDWPMDCHACSTEMVRGSEGEGKFVLAEESRPAQVPYRCLLPRDLDNFLVPVCLSASHVGWGAIRLEPTWMHIGEAAGMAAALAHQCRQAVGHIDGAELTRVLAVKGVRTEFPYS